MSIHIQPQSSQRTQRVRKIKLLPSVLSAFSAVIIFFPTNSILYSEPIQKYDREIAYTEKRILDYKKDISEFPEFMNLFYKGKFENYLVFYDLNGHEAYFKYRRDRFDIDNDERVKELIYGYAFKVSGKFLGLIEYKTSTHIDRYSQAYLKREQVTENTKKNKQNIPLFQFKEAIPLQKDQLLF